MEWREARKASRSKFATVWSLSLTCSRGWVRIRETSRKSSFVFLIYSVVYSVLRFILWFSILWFFIFWVDDSDPKKIYFHHFWLVFSHRNAVPFTPTQTEAIISGMQHGLTLVVGPPGKWKWGRGREGLFIFYEMRGGKRMTEKAENVRECPGKKNGLLHALTNRSDSHWFILPLCFLLLTFTLFSVSF